MNLSQPMVLDETLHKRGQFFLNEFHFKQMLSVVVIGKWPPVLFLKIDSIIVARNMMPVPKMYDPVCRFVGPDENLNVRHAWKLPENVRDVDVEIVNAARELRFVRPHRLLAYAVLCLNLFFKCRKALFSRWPALQVKCYTKDDRQQKHDQEKLRSFSHNQEIRGA